MFKIKKMLFSKQKKIKLSLLIQIIIKLKIRIKIIIIIYKMKKTSNNYLNLKFNKKLQLNRIIYLKIIHQFNKTNKIVNKQIKLIKLIYQLETKVTT